MRPGFGIVPLCVLLLSACSGDPMGPVRTAGAGAGGVAGTSVAGSSAGAGRPGAAGSAGTLGGAGVGGSLGFAGQGGGAGANAAGAGAGRAGGGPARRTRSARCGRSRCHARSYKPLFEVPRQEVPGRIH